MSERSPVREAGSDAGGRSERRARERSPSRSDRARAATYSEDHDRRYRSRAPRDEGEERRSHRHGERRTHRDEDPWSHRHEERRFRRDDQERRSHRREHRSHRDDRPSPIAPSSSHAYPRAPSRSPSPRRSPPPAAQPNFERSGLLAKESNSVNGVVLKYHEPPEAKKPRSSWRLFVFKEGKEIVVDILTEHPSCSKQHAVIQFRQVAQRNEFGDERRAIQYVAH